MRSESVLSGSERSSNTTRDRLLSPRDDALAATGGDTALREVMDAAVRAEQSDEFTVRMSLSIPLRRVIPALHVVLLGAGIMR